MIVFTAVAVKFDPNIWKQLEQKEYSVIFISLEIVFAPQSHFWKHTVAKKDNKFGRCLACIVVDRAHLIWELQEF